MFENRKDALGLIIEGLKGVNECVRESINLGGGMELPYKTNYCVFVSSKNKKVYVALIYSKKEFTSFEKDYSASFSQVFDSLDKAKNYKKEFTGPAKDWKVEIIEGLKREEVSEYIKGGDELEDYLIDNYKNLIKSKTVLTVTKDIYFGTEKMFDADDPTYIGFVRAGFVGKDGKIIVKKGTKVIVTSWDRMEGPIFQLVSDKNTTFTMIDLENVEVSINECRGKNTKVFESEDDDDTELVSAIFGYDILYSRKKKRYIVLNGEGSEVFTAKDSMSAKRWAKENKTSYKWRADGKWDWGRNESVELFESEDVILYEGKKLSKEQIKWLFANNAAVSKGDSIEVNWDKANSSGWRKELGGPEGKVSEGKGTKSNEYCKKFKKGDRVRFVHAGGQLSPEVATITGYDKDGFYEYLWDDGEKSNGSGDVSFRKA